ncbi:Holliday junction resolvase RuvX [Candidatus Blochmannia ocreatus (nom. nud.)]|uniref:Putative pre-16S rRNA nuclease n=1 Tax=Candidatus Blochmannia ocreatus (nom. nud.) TaxID=251538 RepID=A0ABY4STU9_9ENTR|nr:Holliday junction resolvase RuvX [Candidatus Blochmannia ocreatus]URJ25316.1 Holliday junction resolvase RuvX [Candidatus Blochmannia ocreatus]
MAVIDIIMGFDFGTKYIGVAIGQTLTCTANPLTVLKTTQSGKPNWSDIQSICNTWKPVILIVGLPLGVDGSEQHITILAKKFAKQLEKRFCITVKMHDERFSSSEARSYFFKHDNNHFLYARKQHTDIRLNAVAAKVILRSWLNTL